MSDDETSQRPGGGCPHCPTITSCDCPETHDVCKTGRCPCPPSCPCHQGCWPFGDDGGEPPWKRRGCLLQLLILVIVVVIITILIFGDDDEDDGRRVSVTTPRAQVTTTIGGDLPVVPAPQSTTTTVLAGTPIPSDLEHVLDEYCLWPDDDARATTLEQLLGDALDARSGPEPGGTAPPIEPADRDPALTIDHAGALRGGCKADEPYAAVVGVLGGPPEGVQLEVAVKIVDLDRDGAAPDPGAPGGIGQIGGWTHLFAPVADDVIVYDPSFAPVEISSMAEQAGRAWVLLYRHEDPGALDWMLQAFQRDGDIETSPIAWTLARGTLPAAPTAATD